ncbi:MAG TPA: hypothetical protein VFO39_02290 [Candidatus Sulfotelmatobacter sp.]|nr:hypothetical protein [Candidatus Sulfotelmatobacter sp.]
MEVQAIVAEHRRLGKVEVLDVVREKDSDRLKALIVRDSEGRKRQFLIDSSCWSSDPREAVNAVNKRREDFARQIQQQKDEGRQWLNEHQSELPAVGFRGAGNDKFTEYLRRAYSRLKDSGTRHGRASFGGHDDSPESVVCDLIDDAGTGGVLAESIPESMSDQVFEQACNDIRRRDDFVSETPSPDEVIPRPVNSREGIVQRLVNRYGESLEIYFRHCIDREKCRDISPTIFIHSKSGVWNPAPATCKKWALAVERWILELDMPLPEKADFLRQLREATERSKKETSWRQISSESPASDLDSKWQQLFARVEGSGRKVWWDRIPTVPDLDSAKRYPYLLNPPLPLNRASLADATAMSGWRTWGGVSRNVTSSLLTSFGTMSLKQNDPAYEFALRYAKGHRSTLRPDDFKPLPPIPPAEQTVRVSPAPVRKPRRADAIAERRKTKAKQIEKGLIAILESSEFSEAEKREFVRITDNVDMPRAKLARKLKISPAVLRRRLVTLKEWGQKDDN